MLLTHVAGEPSAGGVDAEQSAPVASGQGSCRFMIWGHYTKNLIWYLFKGFLNVLKIRVWSPHRFGFPAFQFWARPLEMALVDAIKCPFQDSCKTHSWRFPLGAWMMHFIRFFFHPRSGNRKMPLVSQNILESEKGMTNIDKQTLSFFESW